MTNDSPLQDVFTHDLSNARHVVALTVPVIVETGDEAVSVEHARGLYGFSSFKKARAFATSCNDAVASMITSNKVAFLFTRHATPETDND